MEPNARYLLVGAFTLVSAILVFFLITWMDGDEGTGDRRLYPVVFHDSISGLSLGSEVQYLGVPVGSVVDFRLLPSAKPAVEVTIAVDENIPVTANTHANLTMLGVTGLAIIELLPGVPTEGVDADEPVTLQGSGSLITRLSASSEDIARDLTEVLLGLDRLLSAENTQSVTRILRNTANASDNLSSMVSRVDALSASLLTTNRELQTVLQRVHSLATNAEQAVLPELTASLANINTASLALADAFQRNDLAEGLGSVQALSQQLIATLAEIENLVEQLQQRPASILYQREERGVELAP